MKLNQLIEKIQQVDSSLTQQANKAVNQFLTIWNCADGVCTIEISEKDWSYEKWKHCVRNAYTFTKEEIQYAARTELTWVIANFSRLKLIK